MASQLRELNGTLMREPIETLSNKSFGMRYEYNPSKCDKPESTQT